MIVFKDDNSGVIRLVSEEGEGVSFPIFSANDLSASRDGDLITIISADRQNREQVSGWVYTNFKRADGTQAGDTAQETVDYLNNEFTRQQNFGDLPCFSDPASALSDLGVGQLFILQTNIGLTQVNLLSVTA